MAKLNVRGMRKVKASLKKKIILAARHPEIRKGVTNIIVKQIQDNPVGQAADNTIKWRKSLSRTKNKRDPKHQEDKINFTLTGELMDDLRRGAKVGRIKNGVTYIIEHTSRLHKYYKNKKGRAIKPKGGKQSYKQIYNHIIKIKPKYDYLKFSSKLKSDVLKYVKDEIFKKIR